MDKTLFNDCRHCEKSSGWILKGEPFYVCRHTDDPDAPPWGLPSDEALERDWKVHESEVESKTNCEWFRMVDWHPLNKNPQLELF